jgi:hypothetical protein
MELTYEQIKSFFDYVAHSNLVCDLSIEDIKTPRDFNAMVHRYFGAYLSWIILEEEALVDAPLLINGTSWEQVIAKWRMSLSQ